MSIKNHILFLNGNGSSDSLLAIGNERKVVLKTEKNAFQQIGEFLKTNKDEYVFGYLGYDLKNDLENLKSENPDSINFPLVHLFVPTNIAKITSDGVVHLLKGDLKLLKDELSKLEHTERSDKLERNQIYSSLTKEAYLTKIKQVQHHIQLGDIYEANFCYAFKAVDIQINPLGVYQKLNSKTVAPFSVYGQFDEHFILSASPERFIKKTGRKVTSQPIKGTIRRGKTIHEDEALKKQLASNQKDRSENVMIVDLVRNDLSRIANPSSVKVEKLCEIYSFKNIHQMISTVTAEVDNYESLDIIKALFPMGSMTGAPKISAMQLMEGLEEHKRGVYAGCIGYFAPNGDFDFNVVIRTILYNQKEKKLSFSVGGAITNLSLPEEEYQETLLKAEALIQALTE